MSSAVSHSADVDSADLIALADDVMETFGSSSARDPGATGIIGQRSATSPPQDKRTADESLLRQFRASVQEAAAIASSSRGSSSKQSSLASGSLAAVTRVTHEGPSIESVEAPAASDSTSAAVVTSAVTSIPVSADELAAMIERSRQEGAELSCPAGWNFSVYDGDIALHFEVPSSEVVVTRGAVKYVDHFNRFGAQTRFRFQLCRKFLQGRCSKDVECTYIHAKRLPSATQVHLNVYVAPMRGGGGVSSQTASTSDDGPKLVSLAEVGREETDSRSRSRTIVAVDPPDAPAYDTLPPGFQLMVYPPNATGQAPQSIASEKIIRTVGAVTALNAQLAAAAAGNRESALDRHQTASSSSTREGAGGGGGAPKPHQAHSTLMLVHDMEGAAKYVVVSADKSPAADLQQAAGLNPSTGLPATIGLRSKHCAHFQFKRMCNLGYDCHFIHSKVPFQQQHAADASVAGPESEAQPFVSIAQVTTEPASHSRSQQRSTAGASASSRQSLKGLSSTGSRGGQGTAPPSSVVVDQSSTATVTTTVAQATAQSSAQSAVMMPFPMMMPHPGAAHPMMGMMAYPAPGAPMMMGAPFAPGMPSPYPGGGYAAQPMMAPHPHAAGPGGYFVWSGPGAPATAPPPMMSYPAPWGGMYAMQPQMAAMPQPMMMMMPAPGQHPGAAMFANPAAMAAYGVAQPRAAQS